MTHAIPASAEIREGPRESCGVIGLCAPGRDVARLAFFGLYALQHRGQESAGIATSDGQRAMLHKNLGLVSQVFNEDNLSPLKGQFGIGHTRYSTTGGNHLRNAQPYLIETINGPLGIGHNGNLTNALQLREMLLRRGVGLTSTTDSELITQILAAPPETWHEEVRHLPPKNGDPWLANIRTLMALAEGAYSLVILTRQAVYAVRDPLGLRPLCLGQLAEGGYVVASESCALSTIGADYLREVQPGEIVRLDEHGLTSKQGLPPAPRRAQCIFEYVYFARPDSFMDGQIVHQIRQAMGRRLAQEAPADADLVIGVPDSAIPGAIGYSQHSRITYSEGLTKNRYIGRTFIQPDDHLRKQGVHLKLNVLSANLKGKRVVLVDDSIVRGNTCGPLVRMVRDGGAAEVHVRVTSPPVRHPCFMGVDLATYKELIAAHLDVEAIRARIGADSLAYLSLPGMLAAIREVTVGEQGFCPACFSGEYPITIPEWLFAEERDKTMFENMWS